MTAVAEARTPGAKHDDRLHTIGAVCRELKSEFPDISISKIRYLEEQGLLAPRRTPGGYRLFAQEDVERLETILRLQRDEFLPLRVIKQELSAPGTKARRRRKASGLATDGATLDFDELCAHAGVSRELARELDDYGLSKRGRLTARSATQKATSRWPDSVRDLPSTECRADIYAPFAPLLTARLLYSSSS